MGGNQILGRVLKLFVVVVNLAFFTNSYAQIMSNIGQFQYGQLVFNPAYAGSSTSLRAQVIHRNQFVETDNAPSSQYLLIDAPLSSKWGLGGVIEVKRIGLLKEVTVSANPSYRIKLSKESFLQFGMKVAASRFSSDFSDAFTWESNDAIISSFGSGTVLRLGSGAFYKYKNIYMGLSTPDLLNIDPNKVFYDDETEKTSLGSNVVFNAGMEILINEFTTLLPNVMVRYYSNRPLNYYINMGVEFNQTVIVGLSVVNPMAYGLYTRIAINPKIRVGYHYEFGLSPHELSSYHTNEITLAYGFE